MPEPKPAKEIALKRELDALQVERTSLLSKIEILGKDNAELHLQLKTSKAKIEQLLNEKQELAKRIDELQKAKAEVQVEDVVSILRGTLRSLQREIKAPEELGEIGYFVDKFEVEMKSGLDFREGIRLVQPAATELKPESLSTVRISLKAKPTLKIAEE